MNEQRKKLIINLNKVILKNLKRQLAEKGYSQSSFSQKLKTRQYQNIRPNISKFFSSDGQVGLMLVDLLACCDCLEISLEDLLSYDVIKEQFPGYVKYCTNGKYPTLVESQLLSNLPEKNSKLDSTVQVSSQDKHSHDNPFFIETPCSAYTQEYMQDFFCYYYSTVSEENNFEDSLLTGKLHLYSENNECKAKLIIDTNILDSNNKSIFKTYTGNFVISNSVQCVHCILRSDKLGEYCVIIFRYSHCNNGPIHCRMAEVLTSSSTVDKRYPTVLRMFLSCEEIKKEDLKLLSPHLCLNYSQISISKDGLLSLSETSDKYKEIVNTIFNKINPNSVYQFNENDVLNIAKSFLSTEELSIFLSKLRLEAFAYHYNKVSRKLDDTVRKLLTSRGYYPKKRKTILNE